MQYLDHIAKRSLDRFLVAPLTRNDMTKTSVTGYFRQTVDEFTDERVDHRSI